MKPTLKQTNRYDLFLDHEEQPIIKKSNLKKLRESMSAIGYRPSKPIQVVESGKKLKIIDGHHRFYTAKELGLSVYYVTEKEDSQDVMTFVNTSGRLWGIKDYIQMYCKRGLKDYCILSSYIDKGIAPSVASALLGSARKVQSGEFTVITTEYADKILEVREICSKKHPHLGKSTFTRALSKILLIKDLNYERLLSQLKKHANIIQDLSNVGDMIDDIEEAYNFRMREKIPLSFLAKQITKKTNN